MSERCVLAVDLGTTSCKVVLVDRRGAVVRKATREYPLLRPRNGWAEQDPEMWWQAVAASLREVVDGDPRAVSCVGLSGQMHGLVALDRDNAVLRPAILWNDQRSAEDCLRVYELVGGHQAFIRLTNNSLLPGYTAGKLLWMQRNEPQIYQRIERILLPKDYIRYRLCEHFGTDFSDASGTGLFDVVQRRWSARLLDSLAIPRRWLPECRLASETAGGISRQAAQAAGLTAGTPVTIGGGDAVMQTLGSGTISANEVLSVVGTGGNVVLSLPEPTPNPLGSFSSFCHVLPGRWVTLGVTISGGSSLRWYRDTFGVAGMDNPGKTRGEPRDPYALLCEEAGKSPAGANGVIFLPYLQGERCPHTDAAVRGSLLGMSLGTKRSDILRSIMEGVSLSLRDAYECIRPQDSIPTKHCLCGGGSASSLWRQIQADVFNSEVRTMRDGQDASALGAAIVAGTAYGLWDSVEQAVGLLPLQTVDRPDPGRARRYEALFALYRQGYPALKKLYESRARLFGET